MTILLRLFIVCDVHVVRTLVFTISDVRGF